MEIRLHASRIQGKAKLTDTKSVAAQPPETPKKTDLKPHSNTKLHFLKSPDAAIYLGLSARTLEKHRCFGTGPAFRKLGGQVVYAIVDLDAWADMGTRRSTSDPGVRVVHPAKRLTGALANR